MTDWTTLIVASLGIAGTLGGVKLSNSAARQREDERWLRERLTRSEEWQREDSARQLAERRQAYLEFLRVMEEWWTYLATRGWFFTGVRRPVISLPTRSDEFGDPLAPLDAKAIEILEQIATEARASNQTIQLIAPKHVSDMAKNLVQAFQSAQIEVEDGKTADNCAELAQRLKSLRLHVRDDLGISSEG